MNSDTLLLLQESIDKFKVVSKQAFTEEPRVIMVEDDPSEEEGNLQPEQHSDLILLTDQKMWCRVRPITANYEKFNFAGPDGYTLYDKVPCLTTNNRALLFHGTSFHHLLQMRKDGVQPIGMANGGGEIGSGFYVTTDPNEAQHYACYKAANMIETMKPTDDFNPDAAPVVIQFSIPEEVSRQLHGCTYYFRQWPQNLNVDFYTNEDSGPTYHMKKPYFNFFTERALRALSMDIVYVFKGRFERCRDNNYFADRSNLMKAEYYVQKLKKYAEIQRHCIRDRCQHSILSNVLPLEERMKSGDLTPPCGDGL
jgi:hypothetical protein